MGSVGKVALVGGIFVAVFVASQAFFLVGHEQTPQEKQAQLEKQVASLKEDYQRRIKAADPAEKDRLAEEGHNALVKAVTDKGLSVEEYTSILEVAENDPAVREKILQRMHSHTKQFRSSAGQDCLHALEYCCRKLSSTMQRPACA